MAIDASIPLQVKQFSLADIQRDAMGNQMRQMQMDDYRQKREQQSQLSSLLPQAMKGDQQALDSMAGVDPDAYMRVRKFLADSGDASGERTRKKFEAAGPMLARMKTMPYEQRRGFLQQAAPVLVANGWTPDELMSFDPTDQAVDSLGTAMMTVGQVLDSQKISWHPVGENGAFATDNMGNPTGAGNPFAGGATTAKAPDLPPGFQLDGGPTQPASGGFRPLGLPGERVTSTLRSAARNKAVGGVTNSYHLSGRARDSVPPPGMSMAAYAAELRRLNPHLDVINEGDHVHMEPR